jgi:hypothetical protein
MSRARNIKPGFFKNDLLAECSSLARILFIGLWCEADREGRLENRPKRIKAECLPYDDCDISTLLGELSDRGFIVCYEANGSHYIAIPEFGKHQNPHVKEQASQIPAPCMPSASPVQARGNPGDSTEVARLIPDSLLLNPDSSEKKADADASAPDAPEKPKKQKSAAVTISTWLTSLGDADAIRAEDPIFAYADKAGIPQDFLALSWLRFVEEHKDKPKRQADWPATYRNAVRGNWYHLWYFDKATGDCLLTAAGVQAQRAHA